MANYTPEQLRDFSIKCVEQFLNEKVPLNASIAKIAKANSLNAEQLKRVIEISNTITQLKIASLVKDKTFEFKVADYPSVSQEISSLAKDAQPTIGPDMEKSASAAESEAPSFKFSPHEAKILFIKQASIEERKAQELELLGAHTAEALIKQAAEVCKDPMWLEKLSYASSVDSDDFGRITKMISGERKERIEFGAASGLFKEAELKAVKGIQSLYKEAQELVRKVSQSRDTMEKVASVMGTVKDQAMKAPKTSFSEKIGYGVGKTLKTVASPITAPVTGAVKSMYNAGVPGINKAMKSVGGKAVHNAALSLPERAAKAVGRVMGGPAANAVMDSMTYSSMGGPGLTASGASKKVWDSLQ